MKGLLSTGKTILLALLLLFYIGLHIFIQQHNYHSADTIAQYIIYIAVGVFYVVFNYFAFVDIGILREERGSYANQMVIGQVLLFCVVVLLQIKVSDQGFWLDSKMIHFFGYGLPKKYLFDLAVIIFFPISVINVVVSTRHADVLSAQITGVMEVLLLTIMGYFLFYGLGYIWLVNMAILNIVAISVALYQIPALATEKNGNRAACIILYMLFHIILLAVVKKDGVDLCSALYQGDFGYYQGCVRELIERTGLWGRSGELTPCVQDMLLCEHGNYIHSLLYYFGRCSVVIYLITLVTFVWCLTSLLYPERKRGDGFYVVYVTAFWNLLLRTVLGVLYSFAIVPFPIALPFAGKIGFVADACCVALLIYHHLGGDENEMFMLSYEEE